MVRTITALVLLAILVAGCEIVDPHPYQPPGQPPVASTPPTPGGTTGPTVDPDPGSPGIIEDHPHLFFTAPGHDYGLRERRTKVDHIAVFYNTGSETLRITKVTTHCGCAAALLSSAEIPPGGRGTLRITLDTGTLSGRRVKTVEIVTNDPIHPVTRYEISCVVIADVQFDPLGLVLRATRSAGEVTTHFDVLCLNRDLDLKITEIRTSNPHCRAEVVPLPPERKKRGHRVNLYFSEGFGTRNFVVTVSVFTNSKRDPRMTLDVIGSLREAVLAVPERLYFPQLAPGQEISRPVYVYRTDGKPLEILEMTDPSGLFELSKKRVERGKWEVTVRLSGEIPAETVRGSLIFETDEPRDPRVTVPFEVPGEGDR